MSYSLSKIELHAIVLIIDYGRIGLMIVSYVQA